MSPASARAPSEAGGSRAVCSTPCRERMNVLLLPCWPGKAQVLESTLGGEQAQELGDIGPQKTWLTAAFLPRPVHCSSCLVSKSICLFLMMTSLHTVPCSALSVTQTVPWVLRLLPAHVQGLHFSSGQRWASGWATTGQCSPPCEEHTGESSGHTAVGL